MRRRSYVHTYVSDIQTIQKHAKPLSNTKTHPHNAVPHNPCLHNVSNTLNTQNSFFSDTWSPRRRTEPMRAKCPRASSIHPVGRSVDRSPPALSNARAPHSHHVCHFHHLYVRQGVRQGTSRSTRYRRESIPFARGSIRATSNLARPRDRRRPSGDARDARRCATRARARRKIYIRVHRRAAPRVVRRARRRRDHPLGSDRSDALDRRVV